MILYTKFFVTTKTTSRMTTTHLSDQGMLLGFLPYLTTLLHYSLCFY